MNFNRQKLSITVMGIAMALPIAADTPKEVIIQNIDPVPVAGTVEAVVSGTVDVNGPVEANLTGPVQVEGQIDATITDPIYVAGAVPLQIAGANETIDTRITNGFANPVPVQVMPDDTFAWITDVYGGHASNFPGEINAPPATASFPVAPDSRVNAVTIINENLNDELTGYCLVQVESGVGAPFATVAVPQGETVHLSFPSPIPVGAQIDVSAISGRPFDVAPSNAVEFCDVFVTVYAEHLEMP